MKLKNRITLYMAVSVISAMILLPCATAQMPGTSSQRGGSGGGGRGGRGGDMEMGLSGPIFDRGGERGRGGPGGRGNMEEELSESQINRILKQFATREPIKAKELEELRKTNKERFTFELRANAFPEVLNASREEREYRGYLEWCEKFVADEAAGIRELKEENYDLYKKRLDTLEEKYRSLIHSSHTPDDLMAISVRDLQLNIKLRDLSIRYWDFGITQEQKEKILSDINNVNSEQYDQNIKRMKIEFKQIEERIMNLQNSLDQQKNLVKELEDPKVKQRELDRLKEMYNQSSRRGLGFRRSFMPPMFGPPDQNSNTIP